MCMSATIHKTNTRQIPVQTMRTRRENAIFAPQFWIAGKESLRNVGF